MTEEKQTAGDGGQVNGKEEMEKLIQKPMLMGDQGLEINSLDDAWRFTAYVEKAGLLPKGMNRAGAVIAIQMGKEVGLLAMQAIQNICIINGRPSMFGDSTLALVRSTPLLVDYAEEEIGEPGTDSWGFKSTAWRKGQKTPIVNQYTLGEAKQAGSFPGDPKSPWRRFTARMLRWRPRQWTLRDGFGDVLKGLYAAEDSLEIDQGEEAESFNRPAELKVPSASAELGERMKREKQQEEEKPEEVAEAAAVADQQDDLPT